MASIELRTKKSKPGKKPQQYFLLVARVRENGKMTRHYSRFDFDPLVLKNRNAREAAAMAAAIQFETAEQQRIDELANGAGNPFSVVAELYIKSVSSKMSPEDRLKGDYETHKNKQNTTRNKNNMLRKICQLSPELAEKPMVNIVAKDYQNFLELLGTPGVRGLTKGSAILKCNTKCQKSMTCKEIADKCGLGVGTVENAFKGKSIAAATAYKIAEALCIRCEELFDIHLKEEPLCRKTVREYSNFFHAVASYASKEYNIPNMAADLTVSGKVNRKVDCIHNDELIRIFKVLPSCSLQEQILINTLLNSGIRRGELAGLTWDCFDFTACTIRIDKSLLYEHGYHLTTVKKDSPRIVDISPEYSEQMESFYEEWKSNKIRMGTSWQKNSSGRKTSSADTLKPLAGHDFVICDDFGWPLNPDSYAKIVKRIGEAAGIPNLHPHMFRHTYVSVLMADPDIDIATVSRQAGHASPDVTLRIYTQQFNRQGNAVRSRMSKLNHELSKK